MLSIERMPIYKNKLFLSSVAVVAGFVSTVGIIRAVNPTPDTSTHQSAMYASGREASLIPIKASTSETSSESANSKGDTSTSGSTNGSASAGDSATVGHTSSTQLKTSSPSAHPASTTTTSSPALTSTQPATSTKASAQTSGSASTGTSSTQPCLISLLSIGLVCHQ